jgi:hypothetical protein
MNNNWERNKVFPNQLLVIIFDYLDIKSKLSAESVCNRWRLLIKTGFDSKASLLIEDIESEDHKRYGDYKPFNIRNCCQLSVVCLNGLKKQINKSSNNWIIISKIM